MPKQPLGNTGLEVPPLVLGTSGLGNLYTAMPVEHKTAIVGELLNQIESPAVLDSAGKYGAGLALESLGNALRELNVDPADVVISNKLGWKRVPLTTPEPTFEPGAWVDLEYDAEQHISYQGILDCWEQGNELLGKPYTSQLVSVHDPDEYLAAATSPDERERRFQDVLEAYRALNELKDQGKATAVGIGAKDWCVIQEIEGAVRLDWVMIANSLTIMRHPPELLAYLSSLSAKGVGIINSAVFHGGFLVGGSHFDYRMVTEETEGDRKLLDYRKRLYGLCDKYGIKPALACVQFAMSPPGVAALAVSTSSPSRIADNIALVDTPVPESFWSEAKQVGLIANDYPHL